MKKNNKSFRKGALVPFLCYDNFNSSMKEIKFL